jgi:hypothetical protein
MVKDRTGYCHLKEEALDRTVWRNRFGRGFGPVVRQNTEWMDQYYCLDSCVLGQKFDPIWQVTQVLLVIRISVPFWWVKMKTTIWIFKKTYLLKFWKNHQNCSLSWSHIWKVSFWDLNVENLVHLTWNDPQVSLVIRISVPSSWVKMKTTICLRIR